MVRLGGARVGRGLAALALVATAVTLVPGPVGAVTTRTWVGSTGGFWSLAANWSPAGVPVDGDAVVLPSPSSSVNDVAGLDLGSIAATGSDRNTTAVVGTTVGSMSILGGLSVSFGNLQLSGVIVFPAGSHDITTTEGTAVVNDLSGPGNLVKRGPTGGMVASSSANFTGQWSVLEGRLAGGFGTAAAGTTIASGAWVSFMGPTAEPIVVTAGASGSAEIVPGIGAVSGPIEVRGALRISEAFDADFTGPIFGPGSIEIAAGQNDLVIAGANTYSGGTTIGGAVGISGSAPLGTGPLTITPSGQLRLPGGYSLSSAITVTDGSATPFLVATSDATVQGAVTVGGSTPASVAAGGSLVFAGGIASVVPIEVRGDNNVCSGSSGRTELRGATSIPSVTVPYTTLDVATPLGSAGVGDITIESGANCVGVVRFAQDGQHAPASSIHAKPFSVLDLQGTAQAAYTVNIDTNADLYLGTADQDLVVDTSTLDAVGVEVNGGLHLVIDGLDHDQIRTQFFRPTGGLLDFVLYGTTPAGAVLRIVDNIGSFPVLGTFAGAPEGHQLVAGGQSFTLSYVGGDGNDVTLTADGALTSTWSFEQPSFIGGASRQAPSASSWGSNRLDVWVVGLDEQTWHYYLQGSAVGMSDQEGEGWEPLGGIARSTPVGVSQQPGQLDVFIRGADDALWTRSYRSGWGPWTSLGGILTAAPAVTSWAPGRLDVVIRGADGAVWHRAMSGGSWQTWESLGGYTPSAPAITDWGEGWLDIYVQGGDNGVWEKTWYGTGYTDWTATGGTILDGPAVAAPEPGQLAMFVRGGDGRMHHRSYEGIDWSQYYALGIPLAERPAAAGMGPEQVLLVWRDSSGALRRTIGYQ